MPGLTNGSDTAKKRKRKDAPLESSKRKRVASKGSSEESDLQDEILSLEEKILESRSNYNSINTLLDYLGSSDHDSEKSVLAAVALCRVFCRLMAGGSLNRHRENAGNENTIAQWLEERLQDYENKLLTMLKEPDVGRQGTALTLLLRLVKEEAVHLKHLKESVWRDGIFGKLVHTLVEEEVVEETRAEFVEKYVEKYDDVRYYTFALLGYVTALMVTLACLPVIGIFFPAQFLMYSSRTLFQSWLLWRTYQENRRILKNSTLALRAKQNMTCIP